MIQDYRTTLADDQSPTAIATTNGNNPWDSGPRAAGNSLVKLFVKQHYLIIYALANPTSGGAATLNIKFVSSAAQALSTPTVHYETGVLAYSDTTILPRVGVPLVFAIPPIEEFLQWLGVQFVIAAAVLTGGTYRAILSETTEAHSNYVQGAKHYVAP